MILYSFNMSMCVCIRLHILSSADYVLFVELRKKWREFDFTA